MCALMSFYPLNESIRGMILEIAGKSVLRAGVDLLSSPLGETIQVFVCYANAHDELTPDIQEKGRLLAGVCKAMMKNTFLHQRVEWGLSLVMPIAYTSEARALLEGLIEEMTKCPTETTFEQIERFLSHLISLSEAPLISWGFYFSLLESAQKLVACMDAPPSGLMPHAKRIMTLITKIKKGGFKYDDRLIAFLNALLNKLSLSCVLNMNIPAWYREIRSINSGKILQFVVAKIAESELPIEDRYLRDYLDVLDTDMLPEMAQKCRSAGRISSKTV